MARKGRVDRGLRPHRDSKGKRIGWDVRLWHDGRERQFGTFRSKTEARDFYEKAKQEQREGRFFPERYQHGPAVKLADVIHSYMATNTNRTAAEDRRYAAFWKERFAGSTLKAVTPEAIEKARLHLTERRIGKQERQRPLAPQTILHYLKFLRRVLNVAVRDEKLERNPIARVKLPKASRGKLRFLSLEEEGRLCEALGSSYAPWVRLAILTGLRREEQFSLRWSEVDFDNGVLTIAETKAGGTRYVRLNEEAKALLRGLDSWQRSVWVFPSQNPTTHLDSDNVYRRIYLPAVQKAKLEGVTWHTLRHTFASRLAMAGATEQDIAACLGHSTTALVRRYAHLSPAHLQSVVEKVSAFGKAGQNSVPTRTETGMADTPPSPAASQFVGKIGAGDGI